MAFDPKRHVIKVQGGRLYLPVSARLVWFREEHPDWGIATEIIEINAEKQYAIFRASIFNEDGRLIASATKKEDVKGFGDFIEKAETGSVGRALALCGYGAQFEPELGDGGGFGGGGMRSAPGPRFEGNRPAPGGPPQRLAPPVPPLNGGAPRPSAPPRDELPPPPEDAFAAAPPREAPRPMPADRPQERPAPPRPQAPPARPAPVAARPQDDDELPPPPDLDSLGLKPASAVSRPAPRPLPPTDERSREAMRPAPARPAPGGARVERVREPERDMADPGGEGEDFDDPFADEDAPPPSPARPAAARRPAPRNESPDRLL